MLSPNKESIQALSKSIHLGKDFTLLTRPVPHFFQSKQAEAKKGLQ
jgi:hypothetical protein